MHIFRFHYVYFPFSLYRFSALAPLSPMSSAYCSHAFAVSVSSIGFPWSWCRRHQNLCAVCAESTAKCVWKLCAVCVFTQKHLFPCRKIGVFLSLCVKYCDNLLLNYCFFTSFCHYRCQNAKVCSHTQKWAKIGVFPCVRKRQLTKVKKTRYFCIKNIKSYCMFQKVRTFASSNENNA